MLALLVVPVLEVFVIIKVGQAIGGWETLGLLVLWSAVGAWIVKREAGRTFSALRDAFTMGRMPTHELSAAALVLVGGTLLLAPGFVTDAVGLFFLLPFTRPLTRRLLEGIVAARVLGSVGVTTTGFTGGGVPPRVSTTSDAQGAERVRFWRARNDEVIEGEIVD